VCFLHPPAALSLLIVVYWEIRAVCSIPNVYHKLLFILNFAWLKFELCNSLYTRKVCWNEVCCLDWLLNLLQVCLYCHILIFPIKCAISPKLAMKNNITLFLSVDLNSLTTCAVYADLIPAVSGAVQCCLCMSGIQCRTAISAGRTGTVCYWWEILWPWQLSPCKI